MPGPLNDLDPGILARAVQRRLSEVPDDIRGIANARVAAEQHRQSMADLYDTPYDLARVVEPTTLNPAHLALIDEHLVACANGEIRQLLISMPPQEGKTQRVARAGALWVLQRMPELRIVLASYELELARASTQWVRDAIEAHGATAPPAGGVDRLGLRVRPDARAASRWALDGHRGSMYAVGTKGGLTGRPADWLFMDDPIKGMKDADSPANRATVWEWYTGTARTRLGPDAVQIAIGTQWHEDDILNRLIKLGGWTVLILPAIAEAPDPKRGIGPDPLGRAPGEALPSARGRDEAEYGRIRRAVGERVWNALFQGHPSPPEGGVFKWAWITGFRVNVHPDFTRVAVAVDPSGGGEKDETGLVAGGIDGPGRMYVTEDRSGIYGAGEQWRRAWLLALDVEADALVYEKNLVDPIMRKGIRSAWRNLRREARALTAAAAAVGDGTPAAVVEAAVDAMLASAPLVTDEDSDLLDDDQEPARALLLARLAETLPYVERILAAPAGGPAAVVGVSATRGKRIRATPVAQAYETGRVSHVGEFGLLETQLTSWQEGQDSPDRMDALVWLYYHLSGGASLVEVPDTTLPTGREAAIGSPGQLGITGGVQLPTGASAVTRGR